MRINKATVDLVKKWEGLRLEAYKDSVGVWTIGYGTTARAGLGIDPKAGMKITGAEAETYLRRGLEKFAKKIEGGFTRQPTPNQFGAMLSLAYNIGSGAFLRSTALKRFNSGDLQGAAQAMTWFNKAGGKVLRGLSNRRAEEAALFLSDTPPEEANQTPDPEKTSIGQSTTAITAIAQVGTAVGGGVGAIAALDGTAQNILVLLFALIALGSVWIFRERIKKLANGV
jgi:lysozyme